MRLKVFTVRMDLATGLFDDKELFEFQKGKDVIEVSEHFLVHEKTPTLMLVVHYRDLPESGGGRPAPSPSSSIPEGPKKDWREDLDTAGKRIYDEMRIWRGRKAKREGMPPYLIFNNRELAELATKRPDSLTKLQEINGIGEAKASRWGEEILSVLAKLIDPAASPKSPGSPDPSQASAEAPPKSGE